MQVWELTKGSEWESGVSSVEQELAEAAVQWGFLAEKRSGQGQGQFGPAGAARLKLSTGGGAWTRFGA